MRVRLKCNIGTMETDLPPLLAGEQEVDDVVAARLVSRGLADEIPGVHAASLPTSRVEQQDAESTKADDEPKPPAAAAKKTSSK